MVVLALSTGNKIAVGGMAAIVLPRRNPNFPNQNVGLYVLATVVLFAAMLTTILVFGVEEEHEAVDETRVHETSSGSGEDASDDTGIETERGDEPGTTETEAGGGGSAPAGDAG